jgi:RNA polymerase sigma-70 factor (ECF subfamily)
MTPIAPHITAFFEQRLPRAAFHLREVEEMATAEICKKMAISATNLGVLLFRARNRLRECLEKKGLKES